MELKYYYKFRSGGSRRLVNVFKRKLKSRWQVLCWACFRVALPTVKNLCKSLGEMNFLYQKHRLVVAYSLWTTVNFSNLKSCIWLQHLSPPHTQLWIILAKNYKSYVVLKFWACRKVSFYIQNCHCEKYGHLGRLITWLRGANCLDRWCRAESAGKLKIIR